jgi:chorismate dehydratase
LRGGVVLTNWTEVIGRVSFVNCDPLFHTISDCWAVLPAPPAWLTGHLLKNDCLVAPIPAADFAEHIDELLLLPDIGIASDGSVGSVLLFSKKELAEIKDIAMPTDSSTSRKLALYLLAQRGITPDVSEMGPDLDEMLGRCDSALLIGDRALDEAQRNPDYVKMDLGLEWKQLTGLPMVFGVFAASKSAPKNKLKSAHQELYSNVTNFYESQLIKEKVIDETSMRSGFSKSRVRDYFSEVTNLLDGSSIAGLEKFLTEVCEVNLEIEWLEV